MILDYQIEAEIATLSHCIYNSENIAEIATRLSSKHFSISAHKYIFAALVDLSYSSPSESIIFDLNKYLHKDKRADLLPTVHKLLQGSVTFQCNRPSDLDKAISIIKDHHKRRELESAALHLATLAKDPLATADQLLAASQQIKITQVDTETAKLKLEIGNYLSESDGFKRIQIKRRIQSHYNLNRCDFLYLCNNLQDNQSKAKQTFFKADNFLHSDFGTSNWIVPGLIPLGETILFSGAAKCGKSNLMGDLVHSLLSGNNFLGEKVNKAKILYGACDESLRDTQHRLLEIGIDLIPGYADNLCFERDIDIENLSNLIYRLETEKPQLVIIDNLTTIAKNVSVSENDPEFAHYLYKLNDLAQKYTCTFIILHHDNKDRLASSTSSISGTSRLIAAPSEIWQIKRVDPKNERDARRVLRIVSRSKNAEYINLEFNPKPLWCTDGIFKHIPEYGHQENQSNAAKVLAILQSNNLESPQICELTGIPKASIHKVLERLLQRGEIKKKRSRVNPRYWVYYTDYYQQEGDIYQQENCTNIDSTVYPPPPPSGSNSFVQSNLSNVGTVKASSTGHPLDNAGQIGILRLDSTNCNNRVSSGSNVHNEGDREIRLDKTHSQEGGGVSE